MSDSDQIQIEPNSSAEQAAAVEVIPPSMAASTDIPAPADDTPPPAAVVEAPAAAGVELLAEVAFAENAERVEGANDEAFGLEGGHVDDGAVGEAVEIADVHHEIELVPGRMAETAFRHAAEQGHLTTFEANLSGVTRA